MNCRRNRRRGQWRRRHLDAAVTSLARRNPALRQTDQNWRQPGRKRPHWPRQNVQQHIQRIAEGATTVLTKLVVPTHRYAGAMTSYRQDDTQRAGLQQTAHAATIAGGAGRRLGESIAVDQDELAYRRHGPLGLYIVATTCARPQTRSRPGFRVAAYNLWYQS